MTKISSIKGQGLLDRLGFGSLASLPSTKILS